MNQIKEWSKDSVLIKQNKVNINQLKLIGTKKEIELIEDIFDKAASSGECVVVSKSELLNNRGFNHKRKFIAIKTKED